MHEHADIIENLGGGAALAMALWGDAAGTGRPAWRVYKWKTNGIPWKWRAAVAEIAGKSGARLPANFLSVVAHEPASEANTAA
jgi:hypothetical protein